MQRGQTIKPGKANSILRLGAKAVGQGWSQRASLCTASPGKNKQSLEVENFVESVVSLEVLGLVVLSRSFWKPMLKELYGGKNRQCGVMLTTRVHRWWDLPVLRKDWQLLEWRMSQHFYSYSLGVRHWRASNFFSTPGKRSALGLKVPG